MNNTMFEAKKNEVRTIVTTCTKVIDGRSFAVRVFFPVENAETMQDKIERMLHGCLLYTSPSPRDRG